MNNNRNQFISSFERFQSLEPTETENGASAFGSTSNYLLDAFGSLGAMKDESEERIVETFKKAFNQDQEMAMRLLFYIRDIRGGQGMRRVFRVIMKNFLAKEYPELVIKNFDNFMFFGRGDDLLCLMDTRCENQVIKYMMGVLAQDEKAVENGGYPSLLGKWMPSANTSSKESVRLARKIIKKAKMSERDYRKSLSVLRKAIGIVETKMSQNQWEDIDFEKLPAKASMIYADAFEKHVKDHYMEYICKLADGQTKVNAKSLFPVDIVHKAMKYDLKSKDRILLNAMWNALPNYFEGTEDNAICVVDVSGSMEGTPMEVAIALGIYAAQHCNGPFHNHFITFSHRPHLAEIKDSLDNIVDIVRYVLGADWGYNTDLEKVFDLILDLAKKDYLKQEDLPSKIYIISDMQFDAATGKRSSTVNSLMQDIANRFTDAGYVMPALVYWNARSSECGMFQDTDRGNCAIVSGYSPVLFREVIRGTEHETVDIDGKAVDVQKLDPVTIMMNTLMNERYNVVITK